MKSNASDALWHMGYCPQFSALWQLITVREHLELYAKLQVRVQSRAGDGVCDAYAV